MIFQGEELPRLMIIFGSQSFIIIVFLILGIIVIKRKRERAQVALFLFYILLAFGLILNIVEVLIIPTNNGVLIRILYTLSVFFIAFPFVFNLLFINILLRMKENFTVKKMVAIVFVYAVICFSLFLVPDGIIFSPTWTPTYSFTLFIVLYIYFTVFMVIPTMFYSLKLYRLFKAQNLKNRLRLYLTGFIIIMAAIYGGVYFITSDNQLFKTIYGIIAFVAEIVAGFLIYFGLGKDL